MASVNSKKNCSFLHLFRMGAWHTDILLLKRVFFYFNKIYPQIIECFNLTEIVSMNELSELLIFCSAFAAI